MFDFLRNVTKSAEEKRQEAVAAYLDGMLNGREQRRFEQEMAQDSALRVQVEQLRLVKQSLRQLPQREVPRNFILDPAKYGRPARQPWVQAYPVLRTATALAAFFFIFAVAAGIFTGFGANEQLSFAPVANGAQPAADVAQIEEVEVTRVVAEETESLAFDAETVDDSDEAMVEAADAASAELADEEMEEEALFEEEVAEEDESVGEAEEPLPEVQSTQPANTAVPQTADSVQNGDAEAGSPPLQPAETAPAPPTPSPQPTATVSDLPRVTPPTPLPDRDPAQEEDAADGVAEAESDRIEATAVPLEPSDQDTILELSNPLPWLQIGLGLLVVLLLGLTFYARKQR